MNSTSDHVVIVGAGHAGGSAAALLRQYGWQGAISLIGSEPVPPYQRPPLSKSWLKGDTNFADLLLRPEAFYRSNRIQLQLSHDVAGIEPAAGRLHLRGGERVAYDHLVVATGCRPRPLTVPGHDLEGIVSLRTIADADRLRSLLRPGVRLVVIGAGYIGLEVAASARALGASVVVIEREPRVLARVASEPLSEFFMRRHAASGVRIILNAAVEAFTGADGHVASVSLAAGQVLACDAVLVGIGAIPNDALARAAGLECRDGIVVDDAARTSEPPIRAIGDCTYRPLPVYRRTGRLESVPNALEQAKQVAADLCGRAPPAPEVPWFWSDQYEARLQIAGLPFDAEDVVVRGDPLAGSFAIFHLTAGGVVQAVEAISAPAEFMAGRAMIARRKQIVPSRLRDVSYPLSDLIA